jgi:hypothetical protein
MPWCFAIPAHSGTRGVCSLTTELSLSPTAAWVRRHHFDRVAPVGGVAAVARGEAPSPGSRERRIGFLLDVVPTLRRQCRAFRRLTGAVTSLHRSLPIRRYEVGGPVISTRIFVEPQDEASATEVVIRLVSRPRHGEEATRARARAARRPAADYRVVITPDYARRKLRLQLRLASRRGSRHLVLGAPPLHGQALPPHTNSAGCGGFVRPVRGRGGYACLGQGARLSARGSASHGRRRARWLDNRRARSVRSRDRGDRPAGGRPSRSHDLRHTRLDALDLDERRKSCSARARLGLDTRALGPRICDRSSRSHPGLGT